MSLARWSSPRPRRASRFPAAFRPALELLEGRDVPSGLPASWDPRGSGGGGALFAPQFNPANPSDITVSSDMSQLFHSTDAGASWLTTDFRQIEGGHETKVQFTDDPNVRYTLDYTEINGGSTVRPTKSTDGGQTWHPLAGDPTGAGAFYLYADPNSHTRLIVTDYTHLYFSNDGGATFTLKYTTTNNSAGLLVGGAFWDGSNIYLGTNSGLLVSTGGGTSFAAANVGGIPASQAIISFAGAKVGATTRFFAVTYSAANVYAGLPGYDNGGGGAVYTLDASQANWTPRTLGPAGVWPFYAAMAQNDVNTAYVAGSSAAGTPTVFKTTDAGATWSAVFLTTNNQNIQTGWSGAGGDRQWTYGQYALGFAVALNNANDVIFTDLGFAHDSTDGGATWKALYVQPADLNPAGANTPTGRFYHSSGLDNSTAWDVNWADANHLFVGNSDVKGQLSIDGGQSFGFGYTGDNYNSMYRVVTHPTTGVLYAAVGSRHDLYQSTTLTDAALDSATGAVLFSADKGVTWQTLHNFNHEVAWVALDPTNPNRLYASVVNSQVGGIYVSNNINAGVASTWTKLPNPPRTTGNGHPFNIVVLADGTLVVTYSGRRGGSPVNFTDSSGVFVSSDGGQTWADRSDPNMHYWTKDLVVDPFDSTQNTWYVGVFSGYGGAANNKGGLYKTTDRGLHWTRIIADSQITRVTSITFNPADQNEAFLTSETDGLWYSSNMRAAVPTFTPVANYPFRQPERVFFNPFNPSEIWVTSFGNGLRVGTTSAAASAGSLQFSTATYTAAENAGTATITVTRTGGSSGAVTVHYATSDGTGVAGTNYTAASGTLSWADGDTAAKTFTVPVLDDGLVNGNATVGLVLNQPTGGANLAPNSMATLTIVETDVAAKPGSLQFSATGYEVKENAGSATITVTRTGGSDGAVTVHYATANGSGVAGVNYTAVSGTLSWAAGDSGPKTFAVPVLDDGVFNGNKNVYLILSAPSGGATLGQPAAVVLTITETDTAPHPGRLFAVGADAGSYPQVKVYDAAGHLKFFLLPYSTAFRGGVRVAVGDVNGDGTPDIITAPGPGGGPQVRVFDGRTGTQLPGAISSFNAFEANFTGGVFVAAGDVNGDGKADVIVAAGAGGGPRVRTFNGATGQQLAGPLGSFYAYSPGFTGGVHVAAGDIDGDGRADIITGAGGGGGPHVVVYSGQTGLVIRSFYAYAPTFDGGVWVAAGDVDGDGRADIVTGAGVGVPTVRVFRGTDLALLKSFTAFPANAVGGVRVAAADFDGDGKADLLVGPGRGYKPEVKALRGTDLKRLLDFNAFDPTFLGGVFVG